MKKKWKIIIVIAAALVVLRLLSPFFVTRYVNSVLGSIEGYEGSISDVDIHLYRGAYKIHDLKIFTVEGDRKIPFIDIPDTDLSIEWSALFDGAIAGEVVFTHPELNFIGGTEEKQSGEGVDWTEPIKDLMLIRINRLEINDGKIVFYDFSTEPRVDLHLDSIYLVATNLSNAESVQKALPSSVTASATSIGNGKLSLEMNINVLKRIPDLDLNLSFEGIHMPALNDFFRAYARVDVERGVFNLYTEMIIDNGNLSGYVKPIAEDVKILDWSKDKRKPLELIWESIAGTIGEIFENQPEEQLATRVPLQGNVASVKTSAWPAIWNIFRNAFVEAFSKSTDNTVRFFGDEEK